MNTYTYQSFFRTPDSFMDLIGGEAKKFKISRVTFTKARKQPDFGTLFKVQITVKAVNYIEGYEATTSHIRFLQDALSFYYSMSVEWIYWHHLLIKKGSGVGILSAYSTHRQNIDRSWGPNDLSDIDNIIAVMKSDDTLENSLYFYNSFARLETMHLHRARLPVLFQLIESAVTRNKPNKPGGFVPTNHICIENMLGSKLYDRLYVKKPNTDWKVRDAIAHGDVTADVLSDINGHDIEETILQVRSELLARYGIKGRRGVETRVGVVRYFNRETGAVRARILKPRWDIENYIRHLEKNKLYGIVGVDIGPDW